MAFNTSSWRGTFGLDAAARMAPGGGAAALPPEGPTGAPPRARAPDAPDAPEAEAAKLGGEPDAAPPPAPPRWLVDRLDADFGPQHFPQLPAVWARGQAALTAPRGRPLGRAGQERLLAALGAGPSAAAGSPVLPHLHAIEAAATDRHGRRLPGDLGRDMEALVALGAPALQAGATDLWVRAAAAPPVGPVRAPLAWEELPPLAAVVAPLRPLGAERARVVVEALDSLLAAMRNQARAGADGHWPVSLAQLAALLSTLPADEVGAAAAVVAEVLRGPVADAFVLFACHLVVRAPAAARTRVPAVVACLRVDSDGSAGQSAAQAADLLRALAEQPPTSCLPAAASAIAAAGGAPTWAALAAGLRATCGEPAGRLVARLRGQRRAAKTVLRWAEARLDGLAPVGWRARMAGPEGPQMSQLLSSLSERRLACLLATMVDTMETVRTVYLRATQVPWGDCAVCWLAVCALVACEGPDGRAKFIAFFAGWVERMGLGAGADRGAAAACLRAIWVPAATLGEMGGPVLKVSMGRDPARVARRVENLVALRPSVRRARLADGRAAARHHDDVEVARLHAALTNSENVQAPHASQAVEASLRRLAARYPDVSARLAACEALARRLQAQAAGPEADLDPVLRRRRGGAREIDHAWRALSGGSHGDDLSPPILSHRHARMLVGLVCLAAAEHRAPAGADATAQAQANLSHALVLGLASCIEDDGHRVCPTGVRHRLTIALQGYVDEVQIDPELRAAPSPAPGTMLSELAQAFVRAQGSTPSRRHALDFRAAAMARARVAFADDLPRQIAFEDQLHELMRLQSWI